MKGTAVVYLCGFFLAILSGTPTIEPCQMDGSMMAKILCMTPAGSDGESENSTNKVQHNNTEEMRLNGTAEMLKNNDTLEENSTELLKARVKRTTQKRPPLIRKPWDPFSSNGSRFALHSENEMEEMRLNETAEILKANETVAENSTELLKARVKRTTHTRPPLIRKPWDPFSSNGSRFALHSENEMEEMRLNETAGIIKANETVAEELTTQLPKTREKRTSDKRQDTFSMFS